MTAEARVYFIEFPGWVGLLIFAAVIALVFALLWYGRQREGPPKR